MLTKGRFRKVGRGYLITTCFFLLPYNGHLAPQKLDFMKERVWVHMSELPLSCMNEERGKIIGATISEVIEVDTQIYGSGWGKFLRVLVLLDLSKPLARGRTISVMGRKFWIPLRYEKLPYFCFTCGCIVHGKGICEKKDIDGGEQFGMWLRAVGRGKTREVYSK